jgi:hypothetical protein
MSLGENANFEILRNFCCDFITYQNKSIIDERFFALHRCLFCTFVSKNLNIHTGLDWLHKFQVLTRSLLLRVWCVRRMGYWFWFLATTTISKNQQKKIFEKKKISIQIQFEIPTINRWQIDDMTKVSTVIEVRTVESEFWEGETQRRQKLNLENRRSS